MIQILKIKKNNRNCVYAQKIKWKAMEYINNKETI